MRRSQHTQLKHLHKSKGKLKCHKKQSKLKEREFGFFKGKITLSEDFDEPLDEFKGYM